MKFRIKEYPGLVAAIRLQMREAGITQTELGYQLGVSRSAVSRWLSGATNPPPEMLFSMLEILDIEMTLKLNLTPFKPS
jgi:transcriptional regulator with XRE-family HTH domain